MGGKRPDQHRIDVDEGGATDYKQYPDLPNEAVRDSRKLGSSKADAEAGQPTPSGVPHPDAERARGEQNPELKGAGPGAGKKKQKDQAEEPEDAGEAKDDADEAKDES